MRRETRTGRVSAAAGVLAALVIALLAMFWAGNRPPSRPTAAGAASRGGGGIPRGGGGGGGGRGGRATEPGLVRRPARPAPPRTAQLLGPLSRPQSHSVALSRRCRDGPRRPRTGWRRPPSPLT